MEKKIWVILFLFLFGIYFCSAKMEITQPFEKYNFGDSITFTLTLNPESVSGSFEINLVCGDNSTNVYRVSPADSAFFVGKEQKLTHRIVLTKEFIGNISGNCYIAAKLGPESVSTNHFSLSDVINLNVKLDKVSYKPGEMVVWDLDANKANGVTLNGFVDILGEENITKEVLNGKASNSFEVPKNALAGNYKITFFAYDKDENGVLNKATFYASYDVEQVATSIVVSLPNNEINPGNNYEFVADLLDQSGQKMISKLSVVLIPSTGSEKQIEINSGENSFFEIAKASAPGKYEFSVSYGDLKETKNFIVNEYPLVDIIMKNSSLVVVKNIGNVKYTKPLNVIIGDKNISLALNLDVGKSKEFNLAAPNGVYDVFISSGENSAQGQVMLTGKAISVSEGNGFGFIEQNPIVWVFIVLILLCAAIIMIVKYGKKRTYKYGERQVKLAHSTGFRSDDQKADIVAISAKAHMNKQFVDLGKPMVSEAESNLSMKGSKDYCSVISLAVKNSSTLGSAGKNKLNEIVSDAKGNFGVVDARGSHLLIIFSPLITKTFRNEIIASKVAMKIKEQIEGYNKLAKDKIEFNLGINSGDMISSLINGKLNYTSLGNAIILAKRISDLGSGKILVSGTIRQKLMRELKVNKIEHSLGNVEVFEVTRIADVEANADKLRDLLKRTSFS